DDARPAFIANTGPDVTLRRVTAQRGGGRPYDIGFEAIDGDCLARSTASGGGTLRVSTPDATPDPARNCNAGLDLFSVSGQAATQTGVAGAGGAPTRHTAGAQGAPP